MVHILGYRSGARYLLVGFDAVLSSSHIEQQSIAIMEAMAAGLPVYSTDVGAASIMIDQGGNGRIFDPRDTTELVDTLVAISKSIELRVAYGLHSQQIVRHRFLPDNILLQMGDL
jgi:glycosyltransferase involved in cell wall biosynthesis